jgi:SAM-dependent methyltransferase
MTTRTLGVLVFVLSNMLAPACQIVIPAEWYAVPVSVQQSTLRAVRRCWFRAVLGAGICWLAAAGWLSPARAATNRYASYPRHHPDGIGKFYMGREIARVMGHEAADWLERPERERQEHSELLIEQLNLKPGAVVADIGAGTGYFSRRLANKVGPTGRVLAVDIQREMLRLLTKSLAAKGITNVVPILGSATDPRLRPASVDLVLMVDVYHEFDFPYEMTEAICRAVKPGGRVVLVEYRGEDPSVPIKFLHKMTERQVRAEMSVLPLDWMQTIEVLPWQHIIVFTKREARGAGGKAGGRQSER